MFEKSALQDVQMAIEFWESEKVWDKIAQKICYPFSNKEKALYELKFEEKQLKEKIGFLEKKNVGEKE